MFPGTPAFFLETFWLPGKGPSFLGTLKWFLGMVHRSSEDRQILTPISPGCNLSPTSLPIVIINHYSPSAFDHTDIEAI